MNFRLLLLLPFIFLLQSCQDARVPLLSSGATIVAFGDSLTAGVGASKGADYPAQLAEMSHLTVINAGISGETTSKGLKRLPGILAKHSPELLILLEGGNDFLRNHPLADTKRNLAAMIELAQSQGATVLLIAVPKKSLFLTPSPIYAELAQEYQLVLLEETLSELLGSPSKKSDTIHLNDSGYRVLAEAINHHIDSA
ncbi:GDSL-type esterase/lipase family protein [Shewanella kaireitica]|uniref:GDSL-type esterase/lipase family protein n=1 Tax=Shewanella kaireitica TaxID=212021 RepID=UPI0020108FE0|nr:GDSL-type esterase/lipase family protein [Shewanella kaireitica]MCL1092704.1 GDSL-type esterase/lipase family protein [Shewanella kaireitica]